MSPAGGGGCVTAEDQLPGKPTHSPRGPVRTAAGRVNDLQRSVGTSVTLWKCVHQGKTPADQAEGDSELATYLSTKDQDSSAREDLETAV